MINRKKLYYLKFILLAIFVGTFINYLTSTNINNNHYYKDKNISINNINISNHSGIKYFISKDKDSLQGITQVVSKNNCVEFYVNIYNYSDLIRKNNTMIMFVNNQQVKFKVNDEKSNYKYAFHLKAKQNNLFKITINNLNLNKQENSLLIRVCKDRNNYNILDDFEERVNNSSIFINCNIISSSNKNSDVNAYNIKKLCNKEQVNLKDGIYINSRINKNKLNISPVIKSNLKDKIMIPIVIKNEKEFEKISMILLIDNIQVNIEYMKYAKYITNNCFAKTGYIPINIPNKKGTYNINAIMICKSSRNIEIYNSNNINLIME